MTSGGFDKIAMPNRPNKRMAARRWAIDKTEYQQEFNSAQSWPTRETDAIALSPSLIIIYDKPTSTSSLLKMCISQTIKFAYSFSPELPLVLLLLYHKPTLITNDHPPAPVTPPHSLYGRFQGEWKFYGNRLSPFLNCGWHSRGGFTFIIDIRENVRLTFRASPPLYLDLFKWSS